MKVSVAGFKSKGRKVSVLGYPELEGNIGILDKGDIKVPTVISKLLETMEEYANYGFSVMEDKLNREPNYFFSNRSFLDIFMQLTTCRDDVDDGVGPESL